MHPATESPRPLVALLLQFMLMVAVCLPTGSIFGLNVKIPVFALFFLAFGFYIATHSSDWLHGSELVFMGCFTAALCFWALIAIFHGQSETAQVFLQLKDIASTVVLAWLCIFFVHRRLLRPEDIVKPVIYGAFARYIWFLEFVAIVAALIVERKLKLLAIAIVVIAPLTIVYYEALQPLVEARFFSDQVSDSDLIRIEQFKALSDAIKVRPLIG